ncbi:MAG TPA: hypothetical protein VEY94_01015, partial [Patescibacteria group bacterium]|nr:hypothetical protein [Patescibacteria group bacterium]
MKRSRVVVGWILALLSLLAVTPEAAAKGIKEFSIPTGNTPVTITVGPDGNLWFTLATGSIGRITTKGAIMEFAVPTALSSPFG